MAHTPGIGALIGSEWATLESLTPGDDRSLATMVARWFFGAGPAQLAPYAPLNSLIALVGDGWTGTVTVTVGSATRTITTPATTSVAEVLDRIVRVGSRRGGEWAWSIDAAGIVTISSTAPFELILTGTTLTRLGFLSGPYADAYYYVGDAGAHEVYVPSLGLVLNGAEAIGRGGGVTQAEPSTTTGATGTRIEEESGTIRFWGTQEELCALVDTLDADTWDVACGGEVVSRVRTRGVAREPWGLLPTKSTLSVAVVAVSE